MDIQLNQLKKYKIDDFKKRGIYYLFDKWELVYVWQSTNIYSRVICHLWDKKFDKFSFKEIEEWIWLDDIEKSEILKYKPKYNKLLYEENTKNRLKCMFNLFRRLWYHLPNINSSIYNMNKEQLIEYLKRNIEMDIEDIRYIVNLKTADINSIRSEVWPIMFLFHNQ